MKEARMMNLLKEENQNRMTVIVPIVSAVVVIGIFQLINPSFLSNQGIITLIYAMSYFLIAACGLTFVIMMGSFDFSVVSVLKLSALICVLYINDIGLLVIPLALLISILIGFINGVLFVKFKVPSFLATLGISIVVDGISLYLSKGFLHVIRDRTFRFLAVKFIVGIPSIFYWGLGICILSTFVALRTPFGRRVLAVGENPIGANLLGINVDKYRIYVFMFSGALAGLAGILYMAQFGGGSIEIGANMMIPLFASVVAGGTTLTGGNGGPHRTLLGVIIITWTQGGLSMLAIGRDVQLIIFGIIAIVMSIVTMDRRTKSIIK